jgi:hypothetical protein
MITLIPRRKNTETLTDEEAGLKVNAEKNKNLLLSRHKNAGKIMTKIENRYFKNVVYFKYLRTTVVNQNLIQEEINRRITSGIAYYYSVQKLLSSPLLSKHVKIDYTRFPCGFVCLRNLVSDIKGII